MRIALVGTFSFAAGVAITLLALSAGFFDPKPPANLPLSKEWGEFPRKAVAELLADGRLLKLTEDFIYLDPNNKSWLAPTNSVVNGASIPKVFWSVTDGPLEGQFRNASIVHDVACDEKKEDWQEVHRMFYNACRCGGVQENRAKVIFAAVYHFGPRWARETQRELMVAHDIDGKRYQVPRIRIVHKDLIPPKPDRATPEKLRKYIDQKNPSLDELEKIDPNKLAN